MKMASAIFGNRNPFNNGFLLRDLEKGIEIDMEDDELNLSSDEEYFDDEASNAFKSEFYKIRTAEGEEDIDISKLSVTELKDKMTDVTEDGLVKKLELYTGTGAVIPPKSIVLIHYNAFIEGGKKEPFDSTYFRGRPSKHLLGAGRLVFGLEKGLETMRKGEKAKFWLHHDYAYGPRGCPPRIPEMANILYDVEVLNFFDCREAVEFEEMLPEDQKKAPFEKVYAFCRTEHDMGNELYRNRKYRAATSRYIKAGNILETVNVANEEEDKKRDAYLLKLYLNLSLCFLRLERPKRAATFARKAMSLDNKHKKALFCLGKAHMFLNEFDLAKRYLLQAKEIAPYDEDINRTLIQLDKRSNKYDAWQKNFCQKMFQCNVHDEQNEVLSQESPEFVKSIEERLENFEKSSNEECIFSPNFTPVQIEVIKTIARNKGLHFIEKIYNNHKIIKVKKMPQQVV